MINLRKFIGLAGVAKTENYTTQQWGRRFEFLMVMLAIWLPLQWHMQIHHDISSSISELANWLVWGFFALELTLMLSLVQDKKIYLKRNWMKIVIVIVGMPLIWEQAPLIGMLRGLQLLLMLRLLLPWWDTSVHFLSRNKLGTTLFTAFVTTTLAGVLMTALDSNFKSPWEGIWWAWETVTTVGYGDIVPQSFAGRVLAVFIMLMGLGLLSLITANFSAYFISKGTSRVARAEDEILKILKNLEARFDKLEKHTNPSKRE